MSDETPDGCELCGDTDGRLFLRARCHPAAPLRAVKEGQTLILRCYVPTCDRVVARLALAGETEAELARFQARLVELERKIGEFLAGSL